MGYNHFEKYYKKVDVNDTYFIAASLDPRFKTYWMKEHLELDLCEGITKVIKETIKKEYKTQMWTLGMKLFIHNHNYQKITNE